MVIVAIPVEPVADTAVPTKLRVVVLPAAPTIIPSSCTVRPLKLLIVAIGLQSTPVPVETRISSTFPVSGNLHHTMHQKHKDLYLM
jgi:hypothetical protein